MRYRAVVGLVVVLGAATLPVIGVGSAANAGPPGSGSGQVEVTPAGHQDVSPPLRQLPPQSTNGRPIHDHPLMPAGSRPTRGGGGGSTDPVLQTTILPALGTTTSLSFAGVGKGDYGFAPNAAPPDTNGAVGATQFVQWGNESFAVFDKTTGALVYGPTAGNTLWAGFGGGCETNNDGDPIVQYDKAAGRWVMTQFSVATKPYFQCVAVSTTSDATGTWNRYAFPFGTQFPDYPKLGVWPDAFYTSFNIFNNGSTFAGAKVCAWPRAAMEAGTAAEHGLREPLAGRPRRDEPPAHGLAWLLRQLRLQRSQHLEVPR
jgi:hypothetical protein